MVNGEVRDWWSHQFSTSVYSGSTKHLYIWNDMNEPSVFNGPEVGAAGRPGGWVACTKGHTAGVGWGARYLGETYLPLGHHTAAADLVRLPASRAPPTRPRLARLPADHHAQGQPAPQRYRGAPRRAQRVRLLLPHGHRRRAEVGLVGRGVRGWVGGWVGSAWWKRGNRVCLPWRRAWPGRFPDGCLVTCLLCPVHSLLLLLFLLLRRKRGFEEWGPDGDRPFVLSRAFFAGTQRIGAIWTGDNEGGSGGQRRQGQGRAGQGRAGQGWAGSRQ